ncbi:MAG: hypothetical protein ACKVLI_01290 [Alphaproteobacteria bacterium]|jgi:hypothetical protein|tara:strand:+ start:4081 stop:5232 length:1152 start_codon:yes stop_codon:yes gene_type:complete
MSIRQLQLFITIIFIVCIVSINQSRSEISESSYEYGIEIFNNDEHEESIPLFTSLIKSGTLGEEELSIAFLYRGISYYKTQNYINSITDITNSLWLNTLSAENKKLAHETRAFARDSIGHNELAEQDKLYVSNAEKDNDFKFNIETKNDNIISLSDVEVSKKIDFMNNNFSRNVSNFFGRSKDNSELLSDRTDYQKLDDVNSIDKPGLFESIINGNTSKDLTSTEAINQSNVLEFNISESSIESDVEIKTSDIIREIDVTDEATGNDIASLDKSISNIISFFSNSSNAKKNIPIKEANISVYYAYIELGKFDNGYDASLALNKITIKHYVALSGLTPYIDEDIVDGIKMVYTIKLGPFNSKERVDFICDKFIASSDTCTEIKL